MFFTNLSHWKICLIFFSLKIDVRFCFYMLKSSKNFAKTSCWSIPRKMLVFLDLIDQQNEVVPQISDEERGVYVIRLESRYSYVISKKHLCAIVKTFLYPPLDYWNHRWTRSMSKKFPKKILEKEKRSNHSLGESKCSKN